MRHLLPILILIALAFGCVPPPADRNRQEIDPCADIPPFVATRPLKMPSATPADFDLFFMYGHDNILDTFNGTYTKDMVADPDITIRFSLSQADKDTIYQKMLAIDFFNLPSEWLINVRRPYMCFEQFHFRVRADSTMKSLSVLPRDSTYSTQIRNVRELERLIIRMIESSEAYKRLPRPRSGYL